MSNAIRSREVRVKIGFSLLISSALLVIMLLRDVLLSGWLLFPLSTLPIPVDWQTPDPSGTRLGITWYARAGSNMAEAEQIGWFTEWISSFVRSQELKAWGLLLVAGIIPLLWQRGRGMDSVLVRDGDRRIPSCGAHRRMVCHCTGRPIQLGRSSGRKRCLIGISALP